MLASVSLSSCGMKKTNDTNIDRQDVPIAPAASITLRAPEGIVYAHNITQISKASNSAPNSNTSLYTAIGDGGLGVDFDSKNALIPFSGIVIEKNFAHVDKGSQQFSITTSGDKECSDGLFSLNQDNSVVLIDKSKIDHLIVCTVKVQVSAFSQATRASVNDEKGVDIVLNPTLAMYAAKNDPVFKYLQDYSSLQDIGLIAKWLKDRNAQAPGLNLKYDKKIIKNNVKLNDLNALTGAQSILSINVSNNANLHDLRALLYLQNLQKVNISNTKVESKDIASLGAVSTLRSLDISGVDLKNVKAVTDNLKNLEELNISGNKDIENLEDIQNLKHLRVLKAANIGLLNLQKLGGLTQITELDISGNDLSGMSSDETQELVNLYNLNSLSVSETHISDEILNSYFDSVSSRNTLKKFVDANHFDRDNDVSEEVCKSQVNIFDDIQNIRKVKSLEYIDLHGNGCNVHDGFKQIGITGTEYFSSMRDLKYLDISDTPVRDLSGISHVKSLKTLHLFHHPVDDERGFVDEGGISMSADACLNYLGKHNPLASECDALGDGQEEFQEFIQSGSYDFTVPENVFKIHVKGCSAGDGGQGGQGFEGTNGIIVTACSDIGCITYIPHRYSFISAGAGGYGEKGNQGGITTISDLFSTTQEPYYSAYNGHCGGGAGGNGLTVGAIGANKKIIESDLNVKPDQILKISISTAGFGGAGGQGSGGGCVDGRCGNRAPNGQNGSSGTDGYLKITWSK
jgi:Leucine-rich repeat (LRR) protein